jgi:hypothetical protein
MRSEEEIHRAVKAWLQATEAEQPWLRRAKWAVQMRRAEEAAEVFNVWVEITPRGEAGLAEERAALVGLLDGAAIAELVARDTRQTDNRPERVAIRFRLRA